MGVGRLAEISAGLIAAGRAPDTPVACVRWGTVPEQRTITGTLEDIADRVAEAGLKPPAIIVIGDVVALREAGLDWYERRPLFGRRVVVTRARTQAGELSSRPGETGGRGPRVPDHRDNSSRRLRTSRRGDTGPRLVRPARIYQREWRRGISWSACGTTGSTFVPYRGTRRWPPSVLRPQREWRGRVAGRRGSRRVQGRGPDRGPRRALARRENACSSLGRRWRVRSCPRSSARLAPRSSFRLPTSRSFFRG